jgi:Rps23 Pro-64 3,4-dihydroxylase Tpa1-like proline 4-hydroxylase
MTYISGELKNNNMLQKSLAEVISNRDQYTYDIPFRHYVIDGLFDDVMLRKINNPEYLTSVKGNVSTFVNDMENKIAISHINEEEGDVFKILTYLNSAEFVDFLKELTGIDDLIVDPQFNGGGIHLIPRGGKLGIHVDFSRALFDKSKYRRVNVLLYLNDGWQKEWGGALELWNKRPADGGSCVNRLYPFFNRLVIFGTAKNSWHGHPNPLECPEGEYRKSLASYYYSSQPGDDLDEHTTIY